MRVESSRARSVAVLPRPFLKWAGGKQQLLPALRAAAPSRFERYIEPFLGGGALFFALAQEGRIPSEAGTALLTDLNEELVTTYVEVRDDLGQLAARLGELETAYLEADTEARASMFYAVRDETPATPLEVAARFIFLNKTCFNGLYRVNRSGRFNVPHGRYARPRILDRPTLEAASAALRDAELRTADFEATCAGARRGDFVYLDPPFHPLSTTSSFTAYTRADFGREDQLRLKWLIDELTERGVAVVLSNSPHPWLVGLYEADRDRYRIERIPARRAINAQGTGRGAIDELLVTNFPH
ncbi:MAG: DNA adenine methylase [Dehalococcoidia bacterium]